jgi:ABC-type transport system involved in resistance to organic solvents, ATPase component
MDPSPIPSPVSSLTDSEPVIEFSDVHIGFTDGDILRGVSFSAQSRETIVLLGETGTGKTLTLKMAAGLLCPDRGQIDVLGNRVSSMREHDLLAFRRKVGFVFQEGALFDSLTVGDNVAYRLTEDGLSQDEIVPRVEEVLRFVELEHTMDLLPSNSPAACAAVSPSHAPS